MTARYRVPLTAEEVAALSPKDAAVYRAERERFDREVAEHVEHLRVHGWINVAEAGKREVRFYLQRVRS